MTLHNLSTKAAKLVADNSPVILTAMGVTGTLTVAYLTGKASFRAALILDEALLDLNKDRYKDPAAGPRKRLSKRDKFDLIWKLYIPAAGVATLTIGCIVMSTRVGTRRAAAVATAYTILEKGFSEYRDEVVETIGEKQEAEIRTAIAQRTVNTIIPLNPMDVPLGMVPCFDKCSGRYWPSSMEDLRRAQNDINTQLHANDTATVTDFYQLVGLEPNGTSGDMGWTVDSKLELHFDSVIPDKGPYKGMPVLVVNFATVPQPHHRRYV